MDIHSAKTGQQLYNHTINPSPQNPLTPAHTHRYAPPPPSPPPPHLCFVSDCSSPASAFSSSAATMSLINLRPEWWGVGFRGGPTGPRRGGLKEGVWEGSRRVYGRAQRRVQGRAQGGFRVGLKEGSGKGSRRV